MVFGQRKTLPQGCIFLTGWNKKQCMNWSSSRFSKTNFSPNRWLVLLPLIYAKCGPNLVGSKWTGLYTWTIKTGSKCSLRWTWEWHFQQAGFWTAKRQVHFISPFRCVLERDSGMPTLPKQDGRIILSAKTPNWLHQYQVVGVLCCDYLGHLPGEKKDVARAYPNKMPWLIY